MAKLTSKMKEYYAECGRSLTENIPELRELLSPGLHILDVGCGSGTITLDVANEVRPGMVVGIDPVPFAIESAKSFASERSIDNVTFEEGDGYHLPFENDRFDIAYSNAALHYFIDPLRALQEQLRVVKPGGWLVAAMVREWGMVRRYPSCPHWDELIDARAKFAEAHSTVERTGEDAMCGFGYIQTGSRCPGWFTKLGLHDRRVEVKTWYVQHSGAENMKPFLMDLLPWEENDEHGYFGADKSIYDQMIAEDYIERSLVDQAMEEAAAWFNDPHAFGFYIEVYVAGRK